jgi:hypothetical protein
MLNMSAEALLVQLLGDPYSGQWRLSYQVSDFHNIMYQLIICFHGYCFASVRNSVDFMRLCFSNATNIVPNFPSIFISTSCRRFDELLSVVHELLHLPFYLYCPIRLYIRIQLAVYKCFA